MLLLILGLCTALSSWTIDQIAELVSRGQEAVLSSTSSIHMNFLLCAAYRCAVVLASVALTYYVAPLAAGSGIPEIKSILSGFDLFEYYGVRTGIVKLLGLALVAGWALSCSGNPVCTLTRRGAFVVF